MNHAFLVRLSVSTWTARKMDKQATKEARDRAGATAKAGVKLYKSVIAADALDKVHSIASAARTDHLNRTVPWAYKGPGAITAAGYPAYKAAMAGYEKAFNQAVTAFYAVYEEERLAARDYLQGLFNPLDYPTTATLAEKFAFSVHAEPMPDAHDFRVQGLPQEVVEEIKVGIEEMRADAIDNGNATAWGRVIERVEKLKMGLDRYKPAVNGGKAEGAFHDSLIENLKELAELIPSINVANDEELNRMQRKLTALTAYTAQDLRDDANLRGQISLAAAQVLAGIDAAYKQAA